MNNLMMSPWFAAHEYRPTMVGPYECNMDGSPKCHFRWWNGEQWSMPIEKGLDDEFIAPPGTFYLTGEMYYLCDFAWRGYNEDQEPL
jgi:hypothetical protein